MHVLKLLKCSSPGYKWSNSVLGYGVHSIVQLWFRVGGRLEFNSFSMACHTDDFSHF